MFLRFALVFLGASSLLASSDSSAWQEEPPTPAAATWLAHRVVEAQVNGETKIAQELSELLATGKVAASCAENGVFFFTKRGADEKQASIYRRKGLQGTNERLIDAAKVGGKNPRLTILDLSADGRLLVYGVSEGKAAERTVRFFDVPAGRDLPDKLPAARYNTVSVSPENKGAYYARVEPAGTRIFLHTFGPETAEDKYIFGEMYFYEPLGPKDLISTEVTKDGGHLLLAVRRGAEAKRIDLYAQELEKPDEQIRPIIHAMDNHFSWQSHDEDMFVLTDNDAPKQRIVQFAIADPNPLQWKTIVPQGDDPLTALELVDGKLFVSGPHDGAIQTRIFTLDGKETGQIITPKADFAPRVYHVCAAHD